MPRVNCKLSEVPDNLKSSNWQFIFSLIVPFCFHVYFLAHFCINFPLYFFVPIFYLNFLCQFSNPAFCANFLLHFFVSFFSQCFLYHFVFCLLCIIFWFKLFVSAFFDQNFCVDQNFHFLYHF